MIKDACCLTWRALGCQQLSGKW